MRSLCPTTRGHVLILALLLAPSAASGQGAATEETSAPWRVGVFVGGAHDSPVSSYLGTTPGRDHRFVGLDAQTTMLRVGPVRVNYAVQLLPFVMVSGRAAYPGYRGEERYELEGPNHAYAWGVSPFGIEIATPATARVAIYGAAAAGGLVFNTPFPVPEGQRLNFTLEYGGGALVRIGNAHWIRAGYKYHHLSNAYTARLNPGLDGHVVYAGYQWAVRLPR
jgi:hypothetical protein